MKIREGHVSNSSSSSSILFTTKDNYDRALEKAKPFVKAVAMALATFPENKFLGKQMVFFATYTDNGGGDNFEYLDVDFENEENEDEDEDEEDEDGEYEESEDKSEAWGSFEKILREKPEEVIEGSVDW